MVFNVYILVDFVSTVQILSYDVVAYVSQIDGSETHIYMFISEKGFLSIYTDIK